MIFGVELFGVTQSLQIYDLVEDFKEKADLMGRKLWWQNISISMIYQLFPWCLAEFWSIQRWIEPRLPLLPAEMAAPTWDSNAAPRISSLVRSYQVLRSVDQLNQGSTKQGIIG